MEAWREELYHSGVKGMRWRDHKYIKESNGTYIYDYPTSSGAMSGRPKNVTGTASSLYKRESVSGGPVGTGAGRGGASVTRTVSGRKKNVTGTASSLYKRESVSGGPVGTGAGRKGAYSSGGSGYAQNRSLANLAEKAKTAWRGDEAAVEAARQKKEQAHENLLEKMEVAADLSKKYEDSVRDDGKSAIKTKLLKKGYEIAAKNQKKAVEEYVAAGKEYEKQLSKFMKSPYNTLKNAHGFLENYINNLLKK